MKLSVVLATRNEEKYIKACLESVKDIADERGFTQGTILTHLIKIQTDFPKLDISHFEPERKIIDLVENAYLELLKTNKSEDFSEKGILKLSAIRTEIKNKHDFNTIKLALAFIKTPSLNN